VILNLVNPGFILLLIDIVLSTKRKSNWNGGAVGNGGMVVIKKVSTTLSGLSSVNTLTLIILIILIRKRRCFELRRTSLVQVGDLTSSPLYQSCFHLHPCFCLFYLSYFNMRLFFS
jgi:hypothetical protein